MGRPQIKVFGGFIPQSCCKKCKLLLVKSAILGAQIHIFRVFESALNLHCSLNPRLLVLKSLFWYQSRLKDPNPIPTASPSGIFCLAKLAKDLISLVKSLLQLVKTTMSGCVSCSSKLFVVPATGSVTSMGRSPMAYSRSWLGEHWGNICESQVNVA